jgi:hypothetical protein
MWWCILPKKTCNLESLVENMWLHSVVIDKWFFKIGFCCPWHADWVSCSLHIIDITWQKMLTLDHKNIISSNLLFSLDSIFLSAYILDASNKNGKCQLSMNLMNSCRHCWNTETHTVTIAVYMYHRKQRYKHKNIISSDIFHFTLHSLFLQTHWCKQNLFVMMLANNLWHM